MAPSYQTLQVSIEEQVATVCLNRPDKANSMNAAMWDELQACFEWLDADPGVRVVILAGNGKHFCAGLDLGMFASLMQGSPDEAARGTQDPARRAEQFRRMVLRMQGNLTAIERCRVPVLAAIHNTCIGGGVDMVCCADLRYATEDAYFAIKEIDIGMTADVGTLQRMPRLIPEGVVRELAYTGRNMDAHEAERCGLVARVVPLAELNAEAQKVAETIAGMSLAITTMAKEAIGRATDQFFERYLRPAGLDERWLANLREDVRGKNVWLTARELVDQRAGVVHELEPAR